MKSSAPIPKTEVTCSNPRCSNKITITVEQKIKSLEENFLKYGKISLIYCCKACQDEHIKKLSESKFLRKGSLKNHEYALIIDGADVSKRPKNKEVHLIQGNTRELRANALMNELKSIIPIKKRRTMTSKEVQEYLSIKMSGKLKATQAGAATAAWRTMKKCEQMFPTHIKIYDINDKDKGIEYIE